MDGNTIHIRWFEFALNRAAGIALRAAGLMALGASALHAQPAAVSAGGSLVESMVYRPSFHLPNGLSLAAITPPEGLPPRPVTAFRSRHHASAGGWRFSFESGAPDSGQFQVSPALATLPLLGGIDAGSGKLLSSGVQKSFGDWSVAFNIKHQESRQYGSLRKPALALSWRPEGQGMMAGVTLARSSRSAGFFTTGTPGGQARPERSQQAEIFLTNAGNSPWRTRIALFQAYYRDIMDLDGGPPPSLANRASVYIRGAEASLAHRWESGARAYLHAASIAAYDTEAGLNLRYRPRQQATGGFALPLSGPLHLHGSLTWYGKRVDQFGGNALGSHAEAGLMMSWKARSAQAFIALDNLLDRKAEEFPQEWSTGRRLRVGWQSRF